MAEKMATPLTVKSTCLSRGQKKSLAVSADAHAPAITSETNNGTAPISSINFEDALVNSLAIIFRVKPICEKNGKRKSRPSRQGGRQRRQATAHEICFDEYYSRHATR